MNISQKYLATPEERRLIEEHFIVHQIQFNFSESKPVYTEKIPTDSGVYFIAGQCDGMILKVYVGKADNIQRRILDYHRSFQIHCPNDRKIAFLQEWLIHQDPNWNLVLYTLNADKNSISRIEKEWIRKFDPLVNATIRSNNAECDAGRNLIRDAYKKYFTVFFENKIKQ